MLVNRCALLVEALFTKRVWFEPQGASDEKPQCNNSLRARRSENNNIKNVVSIKLFNWTPQTSHSKGELTHTV